MAESEAMYDLLDRITACGYSGPATWERKEEIIKYMHMLSDLTHNNPCLKPINYSFTLILSVQSLFPFFMYDFILLLLSVTEL